MAATGKESWQQVVARSLSSPEEISQVSGLEPASVERVTALFPARINPYFLSLTRGPGDPLWRQVMPDPRELQDIGGSPDPLAEEGSSPVPNLIHRYPDRVVLLASNQCAIHCRFCNRRRRVGRGAPPPAGELGPALAYISAHQELRDVLLSGGDPLLLEDHQLESILAELRRIPHVEILRIGTRVPSALPQRITPALCRMLRKYHPLYMSLHFNHPGELTPQARKACSMLADAGIPMGSQSVLLRGINDDPDIILELARGLAALRVKPYYLFQLDQVRGAAHFQTPVEKGLEIVGRLARLLPVELVPQYAVDLPGGGGKAVLGPGRPGCARQADLVY
jgi:lysine 2,3-aminomutase